MLPLLKTKIPGPRSRRLASLLKRHEAPTVTYVSEACPIFWRRAKGVNVWDADGNRFLDLTSAFGVASLGHSNPRVMKAIRRQSAKLAHGMGDVHPPELKALLCARLSKITFERWTNGRVYGQTLLGNSGFEAVEAALKTAMLFTKKRGIIAFEGAYHGLGYGALEATAWPVFRRPFKTQLGHFVKFVSYPRKGEGGNRSLGKVERQIKSLLARGETGAILVEPFQGRGGEVIPPAGFLPMLRRLCDRHHALLIADEIYTGFWRTGKWFAVDHSGVMPDLICLGKALTGCLPLSACVGRADVMAAWPASTGEALHTSTFLGNPLACAAALESLAVFEARAGKWGTLEKGAMWRRHLGSLLGNNPWIREIRGIGMMIGIELRDDAPFSAAAACGGLLKRGIIALPGGIRNETLTLAPPLAIAETDLQWGAGQIAEILQKGS